MLQAKCNHCNQIYAEYGEDYAKEWPNSCSTWLEEQHRKHLDDCPEYDNTLQCTCEDCGEVLTTYSATYAYENPNACASWLGQLQREHSERECPSLLELDQSED